MQVVHEVPPCTDSYNMQVVACAVNPSGRFIRLGLTATHPHMRMIMCKVGVSMKRLLYLFNQLLSLCNNALRLALRLLRF